MKCAAHPEVETELRCSKCGKPICPRCMVQTPVGARCLACAGLKKLPTYSVSGAYYLRAIGAGLGIAVVSGIVWGVLRSLVPFFYLNLVLALAAGFAIREVVSLAVNRKRGKGLVVVGGVAVVISYLISNVSLLGGAISFSFSFSLFHLALDVVAVVLGVGVVVAYLR